MPVRPMAALAIHTPSPPNNIIGQNFGLMVSAPTAGFQHTLNVVTEQGTLPSP